ncbi:hypothetical protein ACWDYH_17445 [Nocardia goodfellowii]
MNLLLHCLPGSFRQKAVVFDHVTPHLGANGLVFGSTVLGIDKRHTTLSTTLCRRLNRADSFDNVTDRIEDLTRELETRFTDPARATSVRTSGIADVRATYRGSTISKIRSAS